MQFIPVHQVRRCTIERSLEFSTAAGPQSTKNCQLLLSCPKQTVVFDTVRKKATPLSGAGLSALNLHMAHQAVPTNHSLAKLNTEYIKNHAGSTVTLFLPSRIPAE